MILVRKQKKVFGENLQTKFTLLFFLWGSVRRLCSAFDALRLKQK